MLFCPPSGLITINFAIYRLPSYGNVRVFFDINQTYHNKVDARIFTLREDLVCKGINTDDSSDKSFIY